VNVIQTLSATLLAWVMVHPAYSQERQDGHDPFMPTTEQCTDSSTFSKISDGFVSALRPWDASLLVLGAFDLYKARYEGGKTPLSPFGIDRQVAKSVGRTDAGELLGSRLSPSKTQLALLGGQFILTTMLDVTGGSNVSAKDYARVLVFGKAMLYNFAVTELAKNLINRTRPDGSDSRSFFSGHVSAAFVNSAFMYRQLDDWIDGMDFARESPTKRTVAKASAFVTLYGWASYVGYSRMHDNEHYLSDVLAAAITGAALGNLIYIAHFGNEKASNSNGLHLNIIPDNPPMVGVEYCF
jgi:membrane-associated phospholipid phosphatase